MTLILSVVVARVGEQEGGLGENVTPEFTLVDLVDAAEPGLSVVESHGGGRLPDGGFVGSLDLDEGREARPGVEVKDDPSQAPLLAIVLLVADFAQANTAEDLSGAVDSGGVSYLLEGQG